jgi:hypothetical protein
MEGYVFKAEGCFYSEKVLALSSLDLSERRHGRSHQHRSHKGATDNTKSMRLITLGFLSLELPKLGQ